MQHWRRKKKSRKYISSKNITIVKEYAKEFWRIYLVKDNVPLWDMCVSSIQYFIQNLIVKLSFFDIMTIKKNRGKKSTISCCCLRVMGSRNFWCTSHVALPTCTYQPRPLIFCHPYLHIMIWLLNSCNRGVNCTIRLANLSCSPCQNIQNFENCFKMLFYRIEASKCWRNKW